MSNQYSRRQLLRFGATAAAAAGAGAALTSCGGGADDASNATGSGKALEDVDALALTDEHIKDVKGRDLTFGFLINNIADDFSKTLAFSGEQHAKDYGIKLLIISGDFDANKQVTQFNVLLQQKVDGIFLTAVDAAAIGAAVVKANAAKIPVFIVGGRPARARSSAS
jgi:ABC-type sugar transport system substrate-binding protein